MVTQSKVPPQLKAGIAALMIAMGGGYAAYTTIDRDTTALLRNQYVQAVAADKDTSEYRDGGPRFTPRGGRA